MKRNKLWNTLAALAAIAALAGCSAQSLTQAQATDIALEHAGVTQEEALSLSVEEEQVEGRPVYEVEFSTGDTEYHYDVSRKDGTIVNYNYDKNGQASAGQAGDDKEGGAAAQQATPAPESPSSQGGESSAPGGSGITEEEAKSIALEHAGVSPEEVAFHRVQRDRDDGVDVYEVEFYVGSQEYDYEIACADGSICSYDADIEGWAAAGSSSSGGEEITREEAAQLVAGRVEGASAGDVRIEEDYDDGRKVFEGELYFQGAEYEFEITSTGDFIEWSVDYN